MKKILSIVFLFSLAIPISIGAQSPEKPVPTFTLTLSKGMRSGSMPPNLQILNVTYTNISSKTSSGDTCAELGVFDTLTVLYNGVRVKPTRDELERNRRLDSGRCEGANAGLVILPGESRKFTLYYDAKKPGTYEFTVEQGTFPRDTTKNIIVKSNTVTLVVPK